MVASFRYLEDIAIADVAFEASGNTLEELFESCALATFEVMVNTRGVKQVQGEKISLKNEHLEDLLFDFLSELIYLKDARKLFFSKFDLKIDQNGGYQLNGTVWGDRIDYQSQQIRTDVKAVTYHLFEIKKTESGWMARVILDT